jgi:hypothetical protein
MMTICLPGVFGSGIADWGKKTVPEMIAMLRKYAEHEKGVAEAILAASDEQFLVETYIGVHVMRNKVVLQVSALKTAHGKSDGSSSRS